MADKRNAANEPETSQQQHALDRSSDRSRSRLARRDPFDVFGYSPLALFNRMQQDMDRLFGSFGGSQGWLSPFGESERAEWAPAVDVFQRGNELVIRADVPGMSRDDLTVEVGEEAVTIQGERKYDHQEEREGILRRERSYGNFSRVIALPDGALPDSAKANFKDGVLEVVVQAPPQEARRGRKLEIGQGSEQKGRTPQR